MTLVRIKDHTPPLRDEGIETESASVKLSPSLLESAHTTQAGRFLLRLLADIDYSGKLNHPIMIKGRHGGPDVGFQMRITVPVKEGTSYSPPPPIKTGSGIQRVS